MPGDLIRDEVWTLVESDVDAGNFDAAISAAFRHVESFVQAKSGNRAIGSKLIDDTFGKKIVISRNGKDDESLRNLFKGAIGFFKGSRSHGPRPIVPVQDRAQCLRVLAVASALLDLLDYNEASRPQIVSYRHTGETVEFQCNNIEPDTGCLIDDTEVRILSRRSDVIAIDTRALGVGQHTATLRGGIVASVDFEFEVLPERPVNWHRVREADVPLYLDPNAQVRRAEIGVLLESHEGGRLIRRCFPTRQQYEGGEYVSWDWSMAMAVGETWMRDPAGNVVSAWQSSSLFEGRPTTPKYSPRVVGVNLYPQHHVHLGIGETVPLMLEQHVSDGVGSWDSRLALSRAVTSSDVDVAYVDHAKGCLRAKKPGSATVQVQEGPFFAQSTIVVGALQPGAVLKFLGGVKHAAGVTYSPTFGMFVTNQTNTIYQVSNECTFRRFTEAGPPHLATPGLDNIAIDDEGTLFIRSIGSRSLISINVDHPERIGPEIIFGEERTPIAHCVCGSILFITDHRGRVWEYRDEQLTPVVDLVPEADNSFTLTHIAADSEHIWVLDNRTGFYTIERSSGLVTVATHPGLPNQFSAILSKDGRLLLSDFHGGRIVSYENGAFVNVASGLDNPTAITPGEGGVIFVANFGTAGIARVVI